MPAWTTHELRDLRAICAAGGAQAALIRRFPGRTVQSSRNAAHRYRKLRHEMAPPKCVTGRRPVVPPAKAVELRQQGLSIPAIGERYGVTRQAAWKAIKRHRAAMARVAA